MVKLLRNFDFVPKISQKSQKECHKFLRKKVRPWIFQDFLFSMNYINDKNLKEFEIFDLTPIGWPTMEWSYTLQFQIIFSPPPLPRLLIFVFFLDTPFLIWTPPLHPSSTLINFPDFVLQIIQRLLKPIVLFAKLQAV